MLRYTLQQQFHQDLNSLHTDAWLEHSSSAGQRALQVGDDSKWVVIASSGLQRAAANVGAGGMLKKNLPVSIPATSAILPAISLFWQTESLNNCMFGCQGSVSRAHMKQTSCAYVAFCLFYSLSAYVIFEGCLTYFLSEKSACYTLLWLMHAGTCRTSTR